MTAFIGFLSQTFVVALILMATLYFIYLVFQKQINSLVSKFLKRKREKEIERLRLERIERQRQIEADRRKVQKIREAYNQAMRQGGHVYAPYYAT